MAAAAMWLALARPPTPSGFVAKGSATVEFFVGHEGQVAPWNGGTVAPGEALQMSWTSARAGYVAVIGREETGATTRWFPEGDQAARLEAGTRTFGDSLRFDPPFAGTVYVLLAESPFSSAAAEAAIREGREPAFSGKTSKLQVPRTR